MGMEHDDGKLILAALRQLEDKVQALEELKVDEMVNERKRHVAVFSDSQADRIEEIVAKALVALVTSDVFNTRVDARFQFNLGNQALRFLLYLGGAFLAGALTVYFKVKGGNWFSDG